MFKKIALSVFIFLLVILLAALVALYLAPGIALSYASDWYAEQAEGYQLEVKDWQFSPFATHLTFTGVTLKHPNVGQEKTQLKQLIVDVNPWALLQQKVVVNNLILDGVDLAVEAQLQDTQERLSMAGIDIPLNANSPNSDTLNTETPTAAEAANPWAVEIQNLEITNQQYQWQVQAEDFNSQGKVRIKTIQLTGLNTSLNSQPKIKADIELQALSVNGAQKVELQRPLALTVKGQVNNLQELPQWQGSLSLDDFTLLLDDELTVNFAQLNLHNLVADLETQRLEQLLIERIHLANTQGLQLGIDSISVNKTEASDKQSFESLQINNIDMTDDAMAFAIEQVRLENLAYQDLKPQLESLLVQQVSITGQAQPLLNLQQYRVKNLVADFSDEEFSVTVGEQNYSGLVVNIERNAQGQLVGLADEAQVTNTPPEKETEAVSDGADLTQAPAEKPLLLALLFAGLVQQADEPSSEKPTENKVTIQDYTVTPAFKTQVNLEKISVGEVSGALKQSNIALNEAVPFEFHVAVGKYNTIVAKGQLGLFERAGQLYPQGHVNLSIRQLNLVPFNGYVIEAVGYQLDRGSLDVDANITFDKAQLGGEINLLLRNSKFTPKDEETIKRVGKQISMPLDTAVGLLRDEHGNLRLNIPLSGDLTDPDVGVNDITKQLTQKALKAGTLYFLKQALQPYGAMLSVATLAGDYLFAIRLDALAYAQGVSDLVDQQVANLTKVAQLMIKKKDIEVQVCPFVSHEEAAELGDDWVELANERGQKVKDWLIQYDNTLGTRTSICRPQKGKKSEVVLGVN